MSIYFSLVSCQFWCRNLKLCSLGFLKILGLALSFFQFTHVYFLLVGVFLFGQCLGMRFSPISNVFSLVSSHAFRDAPHSRFWCGGPKVSLRGSLKMLDLALLQIYTRVFHLSKSVALDNASNGDSCQFFFFLLRLCVGLQMRHTRDFGVVISKYACWTI